jgi:hypothetical protein
MQLAFPFTLKAAVFMGNFESGGLCFALNLKTLPVIQIMYSLMAG